MKKYTNAWHAWPEKNLDEKLEKEEKKNEITFNEEEFKTMIIPILLPLIQKANQEKKEEQEQKLKEIKTHLVLHEEKLKDKYKYLYSLLEENNRPKSQVPLWVPITISILATTTFFLFLLLCKII